MLKYYKINCTNKHLDAWSKKAFTIGLYPAIIIYPINKNKNLQNFY